MPGSTLASHHFAMFLADADAPNLPLDGPEDNVGCVGLGGTLVSPILAFVQRVGGDVIRFPKGVGVRLQPSQVLLLNSHYVNVSGGPVELDVAVNFQARRGASRATRSFRLGTLDITVLPGQRANATAEWPVPSDGLVGELHRSTPRRSTSTPSSAACRARLRTTSYAEPDFAYFASRAAARARDTIRWTCRYRARRRSRDVRRHGRGQMAAVGFRLTRRSAAAAVEPLLREALTRLSGELIAAASCSTGAVGQATACDSSTRPSPATRTRSAWLRPARCRSPSCRSTS
jgi:hypothetical protein